MAEGLNGLNGLNSFGKHLPLVFAFAVQIGVTVWWASGEGEKVNNLTTRVAQTETRVEGMQAFLNSKSEDLIGIKGGIKHLTEAIAAMLLDRKEAIDHLRAIEDFLYRKNSSGKQGGR